MRLQKNSPIDDRAVSQLAIVELTTTSFLVLVLELFWLEQEQLSFLRQELVLVPSSLLVALELRKVARLLQL